MKRAVSLYLDAIRFTAALTVFLTHFNMLGNTWLWWAFPYGTEAVLVFFVLSGFVIGHVTDRRETSASDYAASRAARLYSVVLPALALTALLDLLAPVVNHSFHIWAPNYAGGHWLVPFAACAIFVNEFWGADLVPGTNFVFWSLSYEVAYYVAFGVLLFAAPRWRLLGAAATLAVAGPRIASLFPVWLLGVACHRLCARGRAPAGRVLGWCAFLGPVAAWVAYEAWATHHGLRTHDAIVPLYAHAGWLLAEDYGLALLFAVHLLGLHAIADDIAPALRRVEGPIRRLAGTTFTLYLIHLPVSRFLVVLLWNPIWSREVYAATFLGTLAAAFGLAEVTERRKDALRRAVAALIAGAARSFAPARNQRTG